MKKLLSIALAITMLVVMAICAVGCDSSKGNTPSQPPEGQPQTKNELVSPDILDKTNNPWELE